MAAAVATITELRERDALTHIHAMGQMLIDGFAERARAHGVAASMDGPPPVTHPHFDVPEELRTDIMTLYLQEMYRARILACTVNYICYQHTPEDIAAFLAAADDALAVVRRALDEGDAARYLRATTRGPDLPRLVR